jgi:hypothetical protein
MELPDEDPTRRTEARQHPAAHTVKQTACSAVDLVGLSRVWNSPGLLRCLSCIFGFGPSRSEHGAGGADRSIEALVGTAADSQDISFGRPHHEKPNCFDFILCCRTTFDGGAEVCKE